MDEWADEMRTLGQAFSTLEPQLTHASEMVREELRELNAIEEGDLHVRFGGKIAEYKKVRFVHAAQESFYYRTHNMDLHPHYLHIWPLQARTNLKILEDTHEENAENATNLSDDLQFLSEELNRLKKKVDGEASSVSDTSPLVEIRAAIQHLRKENKELDVLLGVLDNELTQARINDVNPKEHNPSNDESEDDSSLDDD